MARKRKAAADVDERRNIVESYRRTARYSRLLGNQWGDADIADAIADHIEQGGELEP